MGIELRDAAYRWLSLFGASAASISVLIPDEASVSAKLRKPPTADIDGIGERCLGGVIGLPWGLTGAGRRGGGDAALGGGDDDTPGGAGACRFV